LARASSAGRWIAAFAVLAWLCLCLVAPAGAQVAATDREAIDDQLGAILDAIGAGNSADALAVVSPNARPGLADDLRARLDGYPTDLSLQTMSYEMSGDRVRVTAQVDVEGPRDQVRDRPVFFAFERWGGEWRLVDTDVLAVLGPGSSGATPVPTPFPGAAATAAATRALSTSPTPTQPAPGSNPGSLPLPTIAVAALGAVGAFVVLFWRRSR
jgi:hypothetical protein